MRRKFQPEQQPPKVRVETRIHLDNECSSLCTVVEIVTLDRAGLLYDISSTFSELACNIEVGLINTEGGAATDVFYITRRGAKLDPPHQEELSRALERRVAVTRKAE